jgi:hypothetical protein
MKDLKEPRIRFGSVISNDIPVHSAVDDVVVKLNSARTYESSATGLGILPFIDRFKLNAADAQCESAERLRGAGHIVGVARNNLLAGFAGIERKPR